MCKLRGFTQGINFVYRKEIEVNKITVGRMISLFGLPSLNCLVTTNYEDNVIDYLILIQLKKIARPISWSLTLFNG